MSARPHQRRGEVLPLLRVTPAPINAAVKCCPCCGRAYDAETWADLRLCGYVGAYQAHGRRYAVELRNCECRSTIGIEVEVPDERTAP